MPFKELKYIFQWMKKYVTFHILMAGTMKTAVFMDVTPCSLVCTYQISKETCCLYLQSWKEVGESFALKTDAGGSSKMWVNNYITMHHMHMHFLKRKYWDKWKYLRKPFCSQNYLTKISDLSQTKTVFIKGWNMSWKITDMKTVQTEHSGKDG